MNREREKARLGSVSPSPEWDIFLLHYPPPLFGLFVLFLTAAQATWWAVSSCAVAIAAILRSAYCSHALLKACW